MANLKFTVLASHTDWLGNEIRPGDLVIVSAMWGRSASSWLGRCLEIRNVDNGGNRYGPQHEVKIVVQPAHPKGYNGSCHHDWDMAEDLLTGEWLYTGAPPRSLTIMDRNVFKWTGPEPPILSEPIAGMRRKSRW